MSEEERKIIEQAADERYEHLFGLPPGASREEIHKAHIRLLHRFRGQEEVIEAINGAKSAIMGESDFEKGRRLYRLGRMDEALPHLRRAAEQRGYAVDYRYVGNALVDIGRLEEAKGSFEHAAELRGDALDYELIETCRELLKKKKERKPPGWGRLRSALRSDVLANVGMLGATVAAGCFFTYKTPEFGATFALILLFTLALISWKTLKM